MHRAQRATRASANTTDGHINTTERCRHHRKIGQGVRPRFIKSNGFFCTRRMRFAAPSAPTTDHPRDNLDGAELPRLPLVLFCLMSLQSRSRSRFTASEYLSATHLGPYAINLVSIYSFSRPFFHDFILCGHGCHISHLSVGLSSVRPFVQILSYSRASCLISYTASPFTREILTVWFLSP